MPPRKPLGTSLDGVNTSSLFPRRHEITTPTRGVHNDTGITVAMAVASASRFNHNNTMNLHTFLESSAFAKDRLQLQIVEGLVVAFILIAWIVAILMFINKWEKLRILPPVDAIFQKTPKNLERIKVVKRPTDSIIYRNYSRRMSKTMIAREKRLARMNTMPELKMHIPPPVKRLGRLLTMPIIEVDVDDANKKMADDTSGNSLQTD